MCSVWSTYCPSFLLYDGPIQYPTSNTFDQPIRQMLKDLQILPQKCTVILQRIPAHCGIRGNKRTDRLAKPGSKQPRPLYIPAYLEVKTLPGTVNNNNSNNNNRNDINNNNNKRIQRRNSRFFTISSLRRELSPTRTRMWPERSRVQITCNSSNAYHVQHVVLHATWYEGTAQLLSLTELKSHLFEIYSLSEPLTDG